MNKFNGAVVEHACITYNAYRVYPFTLSFETYGCGLGRFNASKFYVNFGRLEYLELHKEINLSSLRTGDQEGDFIEIITDSSFCMGYVVLLKSTDNLIDWCIARNVHFLIM